MSRYQTSCLCGKVQCSFTLPAAAVVQCHCEHCRKMQGSDYSTWVAVNADQFSIDAGAEHIRDYHFNDRSSKSFCSCCGTSVFGTNGKHFAHHKVLPLGVVKNYSSELKPMVQVYTEDKAEWVHLHEDVPIYTPEK